MAVLILACGLAGFSQNMTESRTDLNTMRPSARTKKTPGALLSDCRGIKNNTDGIDTEREASLGCPDPVYRETERKLNQKPRFLCQL